MFHTSFLKILTGSWGIPHIPRRRHRNCPPSTFRVPSLLFRRLQNSYWELTNTTLGAMHPSWVLLFIFLFFLLFLFVAFPFYKSGWRQRRAFSRPLLGVALCRRPGWRQRRAFSRPLLGVALCRRPAPLQFIGCRSPSRLPLPPPPPPPAPPYPLPPSPPSPLPPFPLTILHVCVWQFANPIGAAADSRYGQFAD